MIGAGWKDGGLFSASGVVGRLGGGGTLFEFLADHRGEVFPASEFASMFDEKTGRPSVAPASMAAAMALQAVFGLSDRKAAEALTYDLRWKAACGMAVDGKPFDRTTFIVWRKRIAASGRPDLVGELVDRLVAACGVLDGRPLRALDSTVLHDAVARQDTVTLLVWQIHRARGAVPGLAGWVDSLPGGAWYAERLKPRIDWDDPDARDKLVSVLVEDALAIVARVGGMPGLDGAALDAVGLLAVLAGQDVEPAPGSDGTDGRWRIARRVAPERVISTVDPEARHARKTRSQKVDGFKGHVGAEPTTGLVTDAELTKAAGDGTSDGDVGAAMVGRDPAVGSGDVGAVLGDTAYSGSGMLEALAGAGVEALVKPHPLKPPARDGFTADDFEVRSGLGGGVEVVCPAGRVAGATATGLACFGEACGGCPYRELCTSAARGRTVRAGEGQLRQRQLRETSADPAFGAVYRSKRPMVERAVEWMTRGVRRVPYRGVAKNNAWWKVRRAGVNLKRLVALGITRDGPGWALRGPA
jgi:hypothetical protein